MPRRVIVALVLAALGGPAAAQTQTPGTASAASVSDTDLRELLEAVRATAKATRESVDYSRVVPDILTQILAKLDKIENKLDKIENAVKATAPGPRRAPSPR